MLLIDERPEEVTDFRRNTPESVEVVQRGPLQVAVRVAYRYRDSYFEQTISLIGLEEDPLFGNTLAEQFVLSFEELVLPSQLRFRGPGEQKQ